MKNVSLMTAEGQMALPVEIQLRTIAMDMWASLENDLLEFAATLAELDKKCRRFIRAKRSNIHW